MSEKEPEFECSEHDYVQQLMDDFGLSESDTIGELLKCLNEADTEDEE